MVRMKINGVCGDFDNNVSFNKEDETKESLFRKIKVFVSKSLYYRDLTVGGFNRLVNELYRGLKSSEKGEEVIASILQNIADPVCPSRKSNKDDLYEFSIILA